MTARYGQTLLRIENVSLKYGEHLVLRDVCAEIKDVLTDDGVCHGQVVGFLGPSGRGKTQLFRIVAGLNTPTSGRVVLDHEDRAVRPGEVGVVAQDSPLFEHRTVLGNLVLAASRKDPRKAYDNALAMLGDYELTDHAESYPCQLSGGQRQRVSIVQQMLCSDHYLLLDEPFASLDMISVEKTCALIQKVADADELNTIIITSHDITTLCSVCDHVWLLGYDRDQMGVAAPGARIQEVYDLVAEDLCWHPGIITEPRFVEFVRGVKGRFRTL